MAGIISTRIGIVHKFDYSTTTAYVPNDEVKYNGNTYRNKLACTGVVPTTVANWILIAEKGGTGPIGLTGATGATGSAGANGASGAAGDKILSIVFNPATGMIDFTVG